jgi:hypothetical protein
VAVNTPSGLGVATPEVVEAGRAFNIRIVGASDLVSVQVRISEVGTGASVSMPRLLREGGSLIASVTLERPGLYRIEATDAGHYPVLCLLLAVAAE